MGGKSADRELYLRARAACDDTRAALAESRALLGASRTAIAHSQRLIEDSSGVRNAARAALVAPAEGGELRAQGATSSETSTSLPLVHPAVCKVTHATK